MDASIIAAKPRHRRPYYTAENAYATLMAGFTTVQCGAQADVDLREAIARGTLAGPRILTSVRQINENSGGPEQRSDYGYHGADLSGFRHEGRQGLQKHEIEFGSKLPQKAVLL